MLAVHRLPHAEPCAAYLCMMLQLQLSHDQLALNSRIMAHGILIYSRLLVPASDRVSVNVGLVGGMLHPADSVSKTDMVAQQTCLGTFCGCVDGRDDVVTRWTSVSLQWCSSWWVLSSVPHLTLSPPQPTQPKLVSSSVQACKLIAVQPLLHANLPAIVPLLVPFAACQFWCRIIRLQFW